MNQISPIYLHSLKGKTQPARVAQLVEHDLAKVGVASSNLVSRSVFRHGLPPCLCFPTRPGGGIGRHAGLKILWAAMLVRVQFPPRVLKGSEISEPF